MKVKADINPALLGRMLFEIHTHAEIVYDSDPDEIVYREKDVIRLLKTLGFYKPKFYESISKNDQEKYYGPINIKKRFVKK